MIGRLLRTYWNLAAAALVLGAMVAWIFAGGTAAGEGHFIYPLDDAYIHLAQARNLALHHVWGVTARGFSSSSSSPLWTLLLAASCRVAGDWDLAPLALNILAALGLLALLHGWLRARLRNSFLIFILVLLIALALPLPFLVAMGMEHTLQLMLLVWLLAMLDQALARPFSTTRQACALAAAAALLVATRFEGLFVLAVAGVMLLAARRWRLALALWAAGWLPVVLYGIFSLSHGGCFLPNTLLLKGNMPPHGWGDLYPAFRHFYTVLLQNPPVFTLLVLCAAGWALAAARGVAGGRLAPLFIGTAVLHTVFAQYGFQYRYEAYLVALGLMALSGMIGSGVLAMDAAAGASRARRWLAAAALALATLLPFVPRMVDSYRYTPVACRNIYDQQYQMASFIKRFFPRECVALNDIGLVCYLVEPPLFDMVGLATQPVVTAKRRGEYDQKKVDELTRAHGVQLALIYDAWYGGKIPAQWVRVGQWRALNNYICASDTISIYAVNPQLAPRLIESLRTFGKDMPPEIIQSGLYKEQGK